jgi:hypothetical protein
MPKAKFRMPVISLNNGVELQVLVTIDVSASKEMIEAGKVVGVGDVEIANICGQALEEILQVLGYEEV